MGKNQSGYVKAEYPRSEITGRIIAAAQQVHQVLGPGYEGLIVYCSFSINGP